MPKEARQCVRYWFLRVDPAWRRIDGPDQIAHKREFYEAIKRFHARSLLRSYSLMGMRGDCDLMLWQVAENLETLQALETAIFTTRLGAYLETAYSYLAMTKRSVYQFPEEASQQHQLTIQPQDARYLFVYPFVKTRAWYLLPMEKRQEAMNEHVRIGRKYPSIRLNTTYSFGLDDQEFVVAFEGDDPGEFLDLVMELRTSEASSYTERDTPIFTCLQMSLWEALDSLGGAVPDERPEDDGADGGFTAVASVDEIPPGTSKRIYLGADAVALFNVAGRFYAVSDRCTHGRASLSEGCVDPETKILTCPWHGGRVNLDDGSPAGDPIRIPIKTYRAKVEGDRVLVG